MDAMVKLWQDAEVGRATPVISPTPQPRHSVILGLDPRIQAAPMSHDQSPRVGT